MDNETGYQIIAIWQQGDERIASYECKCCCKCYGAANMRVYGKLCGATLLHYVYLALHLLVCQMDPLNPHTRLTAISVTTVFAAKVRLHSI